MAKGDLLCFVLLCAVNFSVVELYSKFPFVDL